MKIFVTGATGYIGFNVAKKFRQNGFKVYGLARSTDKAKKLYKNEIGSYDIDCLTGNAEFNNFSCPECSEVLFFTEDQAKEFLNKEVKGGKKK